MKRPDPVDKLLTGLAFLLAATLKYLGIVHWPWVGVFAILLAPLVIFQLEILFADEEDDDDNTPRTAV